MLLGLTSLEQGEEAFTLIVLVHFPEPSVITLWASSNTEVRYSSWIKTEGRYSKEGIEPKEDSVAEKRCSIARRKVRAGTALSG